MYHIHIFKKKKNRSIFTALFNQRIVFLELLEEEVSRENVPEGWWSEPTSIKLWKHDYTNWPSLMIWERGETSNAMLTLPFWKKSVSWGYRSGGNGKEFPANSSKRQENSPAKVGLRGRNGDNVQREEARNGKRGERERSRASLRCGKFRSS